MFLKDYSFTKESAVKIKNDLKDFFEKDYAYKKKKRERLSTEIEHLEKELHFIKRKWVDEVIDDDYFKTESKRIQQDIKKKNSQIIDVKSTKKSYEIDVLQKILELLRSQSICWKTADLEKKRLLLHLICSNFFVTHRNTLKMEVYECLNLQKVGKIVSGAESALLLELFTDEFLVKWEYFTRNFEHPIVNIKNI